MQQGTWTIRPCPHRESSALAQELGASEITASVLVRRGYGDPDEARAFLAGEQPPHDPFLLGDMETAVSRIRAAIADGKRICVHGDYDADGICATALAVLLLREAGANVDWHLPSRVDAGNIGFRLAPRINAAGRLGHPRAALDLLLTDNADEARVLADRLEELNRDRQAVEERILRAAVAKVEEWPEASRRRRAYVLWGEDWHEGVIGIVASRLVERYHRPVVLIAGSDGLWKGSGRSVPSFDLHGALAKCAQFLERFGGHRAAAGLSIVPEWIEPFADAFAEHAGELLTDDDLVPTTVVDAVIPRGTKLTLELCNELRRLAPFGLGNPEVTLLVPGCELGELATVGDGKHLRFRVRREGSDAGSAIAFGQGGQLDRLRRIGRYDVAFRLQANHWNGTVAPQLVVRRVFEAHDRFDELYAWLRTQWRVAQRDPAAQSIFEELGLDADGPPSRHPLESETFRALLDEPALERAA